MNKNALFRINTVLSNDLDVFKVEFIHSGGSEGAPREIPGLFDGGAMCDRNCIGSVLEEAMHELFFQDAEVDRRNSAYGWEN